MLPERRKQIKALRVVYIAKPSKRIKKIRKGLYSNIVKPKQNKQVKRLIFAPARRKSQG